MGNRNGNKGSRGSKALDQRLLDYSSVTRVSSAAGTLRGRLGSWPVYAAVAGSALAMTTSNATAGIIPGTFAGCTPASQCPIVSVPGAGSGKSSHKAIPLGSDFLHLRAASFGAGGSLSVGLSIIGTGGKGIGIFANGSLAKLFHSGDKISAGSNGTAAKIVQKVFVSTGVPLGQFVSGQPGFAGLALHTASGGVDYGWLELEFTNNPTTHLPQTLEALAYGIETNPGEAITAGNTIEPLPEPGTMGLALLAMGAAGVAALRRRRETA